MAQRVGRGIALLFHDRGSRRGSVVKSTPRPHFTPGKDPVPILQEAGWAPGPVWTGGKSRPHRDSIPDRPARSQALYQLSYPAHTIHRYYRRNQIKNATGGRNIWAEKPAGNTSGSLSRIITKSDLKRTPKTGSGRRSSSGQPCDQRRVP